MTRAVPQARATASQATTTACIRPYDETFVILKGSVRVSVGEEVLDGGPGDIVIGPAGVHTGSPTWDPARQAGVHSCGTGDDHSVGRLIDRRSRRR